MTSTSARVQEGQAALARFFFGGVTLEDTLRFVTEVSAGALGADLVGITMVVEGRPTTAVFTDESAAEIDRHQYESGRGPCLDAFRDQRVVRIDSIDSDERYPDFSASAARFGITRTISFPLAARDEPLGALNVYFRSGASGDGVDEGDTGLAFAEQVSVVLANARAYEDAGVLAENLKQALGSRAVIDQAIGILMSTGGRSPADAFEILVRASQREHRKLRDIATQIVETAQKRRPPPDPPSDPGADDAEHRLEPGSRGTAQAMPERDDITPNDTQFGAAAEKKRELADELVAEGLDPEEQPEGDGVDPRPRAGGKASEGAPAAAERE